MPHTTETETSAVAARSDATHPLLVVAHHPDRSLIGVSQVVARGRHAVGRDASAVLPGVFEHRRVSREHAVFERRGGSLTVVDQGSRNGTHVNGELVERKVLEPGDLVRIGPILLLHVRGPAHHREPRHATMAGSSHVLAQLLSELAAAGESGQNVMLVGETGTGKELAAQAVHAAAGHRGGVVAINCGAVAEGVIQSELFGHERGAFSGADTTRPGLVEEAQDGTLFLDELGSASPMLQSTLLRLIESGEYRRVGGNELRRARVGFIAATQPEIHEQMDAGTFRRDLWYRLAQRVVHVPPLHERRQDIPILVARHLDHLGRDVALGIDVWTVLLQSRWPGNVRQLFSVVERLTAKGETVEEAPPWLLRELASTASPAPRARRPKKRRPNRERLIEVLQAHEGNVRATARELGVDRKTLYRWTDAHGVDLDTFR